MATNKTRLLDDDHHASAGGHTEMSPLEGGHKPVASSGAITVEMERQFVAETDTRKGLNSVVSGALCLTRFPVIDD
jgi:hypothetical protein